MTTERLLTPVLTICTILAATAAHSTDMSTPVDSTNPAGDHQAISSERQIAMDLVGTLSQIENLSPDSTTLSMSAPQNTFGANLGQLLEAAGYSIQFADNTRQSNYVDYFITDKGSEGTIVRTYQVNVGAVKVRRDYLISGNTVQPQTTMYLRGADATGVSLNDDVFNLSYAQEYDSSKNHNSQNTNAEPAPEFILQTTDKSQTYTVGGPITISVKFNLDSLIYCYYRDGHGQIVRVYPNRFNTDNLLPAHQNITIPSTDDWNINATRLGATDDFLCVATEPGNKDVIATLNREPDLSPLADRTLEQIYQRIAKVAGPAIIAEKISLVVN